MNFVLSRSVFLKWGFTKWFSRVLKYVHKRWVRRGSGKWSVIRCKVVFANFLSAWWKYTIIFFKMKALTITKSSVMVTYLDDARLTWGIISSVIVIPLSWNPNIWLRILASLKSWSASIRCVSSQIADDPKKAPASPSILISADPPEWSLWSFHLMPTCKWV